MQKFVMIASLLSLAACGLSEDKFMEEMSTEKMCAEMTTCNADFDCSIFDDLEAADTTGCEFDADKGQECLDGAWTCDGEGEFAYAVAPAACADVYTCTDAGDDDDDDDTDDTDAAE